MLGEAITAFANTKWRSRHNQSRARFEAWQARAVSEWLTRDVPKAAAYGRPVERLADLPITDKATIMDDFAAYNTHGLSAETAWQTLETGDQIGNAILGASTGTTGNRGLFVISRQEQYRWLGTILAKAIPDLLWRPQRIAVVLPRNTSLYDSANSSKVIDLRFFDISEGPDRWTGAFVDFAPTVIVAPPRMLRHFAEAKLSLRPTRIFSAAETLDPVDRRVIEAYFPGTLGQIYMATEGLFAVTCRHGNLHLAEDCVHFEFEPVGDGLVSPLVSCFRRQVQIMARYRMNDLLRLAHAPCPCGSPLRHVSEVVGRCDDVFNVAGKIVTPDVIRDAIVQTDQSITDFRVTQIGANRITLDLPPDVRLEVANRARGALMAVLSKGTTTEIDLNQRPLKLDPLKKLRRVHARWSP